MQKTSEVRFLEILSVDCLSIAENLASVNCNGKAAQMRDRLVKQLESSARLIKRLQKEVKEC